MKWKLIAVTGTVVGTALWLVRRNQARRTAADAEMWASATDPIARFGG